MQGATCNGWSHEIRCKVFKVARGGLRKKAKFAELLLGSGNSEGALPLQAFLEFGF